MGKCGNYLDANVVGNFVMIMILILLLSLMMVLTLMMMMIDDVWKVYAVSSDGKMYELNDFVYSDDDYDNSDDDTNIIFTGFCLASSLDFF